MKNNRVKAFKWLILVFLFLGIFIPAKISINNQSLMNVNNNIALRDVSNINLEDIYEHQIDEQTSIFFDESEHQWYLIDYVSQIAKPLPYLSKFSLNYDNIVCNFNYKGKDFVMFDNLLFYDWHTNQMSDLKDVFRNNLTYNVWSDGMYKYINLFQFIDADNEEQTRLLHTFKINKSAKLIIEYLDFNNLIVKVNYQYLWFNSHDNHLYTYKLSDNFGINKLNIINNSFFIYGSRLYSNSSTGFKFIDSFTSINYTADDLIVYERNNVNYVYTIYSNNIIELSFKYQEYLGKTFSNYFFRGFDNDFYIVNIKTSVIREIENNNLQRVHSINNNHIFLKESTNNQFYNLIEIESDTEYRFFYSDISENERKSGMVFNQYVKFIFDSHYINGVLINGDEVELSGDKYIVDFEQYEDINHKYQIDLNTIWGWQIFSVYFYVDYKPEIYIKDLDESQYIDSYVYLMNKSYSPSFYDSFNLNFDHTYQFFYSDWLIDSVYLDQHKILDGQLLLPNSVFNSKIFIYDKFGVEYSYSLYKSVSQFGKRYWYDTFSGKVHIAKSEHLNLLTEEEILNLKSNETSKLVSKLDRRLWIGAYDSRSYLSWEVSENIIEVNNNKTIASNKTYVSDELFEEIILCNKEALQLALNSSNFTNYHLIDDMMLSYDWKFNHYFYLNEKGSDYTFRFYAKPDSELLWGQDLRLHYILGTNAPLEVIPLNHFYYEDGFGFNDTSGLEILNENISVFLNQYQDRNDLLFRDVQLQLKNQIVSSINQISEEIFINLVLNPETTNYKEYDLTLEEVYIDWVDNIQSMNLKNIPQIEFTISANENSYAYSNGTFVIDNPLYVGVPEKPVEEESTLKIIILALVAVLTLFLFLLVLLKVLIQSK